MTKPKDKATTNKFTGGTNGSVPNLSAEFELLVPESGERKIRYSTRYSLSIDEIEAGIRSFKKQTYNNNEIYRQRTIKEFEKAKNTLLEQGAKLQIA